MQQNATLSPIQETAVTALLAGETVTAAAHTAGVDRTTLHRWLKHDFVFTAALHQRQRECRDALLARLLALGDKAVRAVEKAIEAENPKVALEILRGLGLLRGKRLNLGSDDPAALADADAQDEWLDSLTGKGNHAMATPANGTASPGRDGPSDCFRPPDQGRDQAAGYRPHTRNGMAEPGIRRGQ